ncbi:ABATE domain-containing protein [Streptomyces shenzhenensis]|uniref:Zf-CGNR multi-domain protein n=1 Tax=Streptomyces shenzhenensis TaxID=943815 RepID=A0A3M0IFB6_9ACTN|nr:CGNR zinc finger domain-containing protein [Streptomyces shenzhenensis]RMB80536.1 zf-CGNR multi-domain protein [Streptomyces shenzhenensis]
MELAEYSDYAVRLVNTDQAARGADSDWLTSVESVRALFGEFSKAARRVTHADVTRFRSVRTRLRAVFTAADEGDHTQAVDLLSSLLMEFPVGPQICGRDYLDKEGRPRWHIHLAEHPSNATAGYAAMSAMGLAFHLTKFGPDRLGVCEAVPCRNVSVDSSTNRSRRYCSERCATRVNVAACRSRKRRQANDTAEPVDPPPATARSETSPASSTPRRAWVEPT